MSKLSKLFAAALLLFPGMAYGQEIPEQFAAWGKQAKGDPYLADPGLDGPGTVEVKANDAEKAQGFLVFSKPVTTLIKPDYAPTAEDRCTGLAAEDCRGQYGPVSFSVFALQKGEFTVSVTDLAGPNGAKIPSKNFDIRAARYIQGTAKVGGKNVTDVFPVLLEAFDKKAVPEKRLQQFWITYYVPKDAAAGTYQGEVSVSVDGQKRLTLPLKLKVFKFELGEAGVNLYIYYSPPTNKDQTYNLPLIEKHLIDQKCHDMTMACGLPATDVKGDLQLKNLAPLLDLYAKVFPKSHYYAPLFNRTIAEWLNTPDKSIKMWGAWFRYYPFTPERDDHFVQTVKTFNDECKKRGLTAIIEVADEAGAHPWTQGGAQHYLKLLKDKLPDVIREQTCGGGWAMKYPEDQLWKGLLNIWTTNRWLEDKLKIVREENPDALIQIYNIAGGGSQPGEIGPARNFYGYFNWKAKVAGAAQWHYQFQPDFTYAWASAETGEGSVPTLRWEMVREGAKDRRYVATLEKLIARRNDKAAQDAKALLKEIEGKVELKTDAYEPIAGGIVLSPPSETYDQWRAKIAKFIESMTN